MLVMCQTLAAMTDKLPAQRKAAVVNAVVRLEDNEQGWTEWGDCLRVNGANLSELEGLTAGAVVQRHTVVFTGTWVFQQQLVKRHCNRLQDNQKS